MIYLVTGFMRSGTSAFMQGLKAGGLEVIESETRDKYRAAFSDEYYEPNPVSLYELDGEELAKGEFLKSNDGKALKVVAPFIHQAPVHEYRIVVLRRDSEEIRQSLEAAFNIVRSIEVIDSTIERMYKLLRNRKDVKELIEIQHQDLIFRPLQTFKSIKNAGWPINANKAASIINPELYRFRKELLVIGA